MTVYSPLIGRFGNQMFQYAHMRAFAETFKCSIHTPHWPGERLFNLPPSVPKPETNIVVFGGYCQRQQDLTYTRAQVKEWFKLRPEIEAAFAGFNFPPVVAHLRRGDYVDLNYVVVSQQSYLDAAQKFGVERPVFVSDEHPIVMAGFKDELSFVPDWLMMLKAKVLFRANSTFSWWAATLSDAKVYSPLIEGVSTTGEQHCEFVEGNHPKFCELPDVTDLHIT